MNVLLKGSWFGPFVVAKNLRGILAALKDRPSQGVALGQVSLYDLKVFQLKYLANYESIDGVNLDRVRQMAFVDQLEEGIVISDYQHKPEAMPAYQWELWHLGEAAPMVINLAEEIRARKTPESIFFGEFKSFCKELMHLQWIASMTAETFEALPRAKKLPVKLRADRYSHRLLRETMSRWPQEMPGTVKIDS